MYPRISDLFFELFGVRSPVPIYSYGAMVALGALAAAWLARKELDRLHRNGLIGSVEVPAEDEKGRRKTRQGSPGALVGTLAVLAVGAGLVGAKLLTVLADLEQFVIDPMGTIFSSGGFTFYGGLLAGAGAVAWYLRRKDINIPRFADAAAPGLILAYGIGRLGCHLAGDGCWGIPADVAAKPDWLPMWLWAETYPNAIIGSPAQPVYPTPIYEFLAAALICGLLWTLRKHPFRAGWLFSLYLVLNGLERFWIEKIRINVEYTTLGLTYTQAQLIAVALMLVGIAGLLRTSRAPSSSKTEEAESAQQPAPA